MSFLVIPLLHGGGGRSVRGGIRQQAGGMADLASGSPADLLGLSLLSPLSRQAGGGKTTGRDRKTPRRRGGRTALAHHRVPGAGDRSQRPHFARTSAPGEDIRGRGGKRAGFF